MIPRRLLTADVTVIRPSKSTSGYGDDETLDYDSPASAVGIRAMMQPTGGTEVTDAGSRNALVADWLLLTDWLDLDAHDRVKYVGTTCEIVGPVQIPTGPMGLPHHAEARLRVVTG